METKRQSKMISDEEIEKEISKLEESKHCFICGKDFDRPIPSGICSETCKAINEAAYREWLEERIKEKPTIKVEFEVKLTLNGEVVGVSRKCKLSCSCTQCPFSEYCDKLMEKLKSEGDGVEKGIVSDAGNVLCPYCERWTGKNIYAHDLPYECQWCGRKCV